MEKQRYALVKRNYLVPFVLVTSLFFLWGFAHAILDVLNKHFQEVLDITRTYSAMVQVLFYLGYFVMAVPAGLLSQSMVIGAELFWGCCCMVSVH